MPQKLLFHAFRSLKGLFLSTHLLSTLNAGVVLNLAQILSLTYLGFWHTLGLEVVGPVHGALQNIVSLHRKILFYWMYRALIGCTEPCKILFYRMYRALMKKSLARTFEPCKILSR